MGTEGARVGGRAAATERRPARAAATRRTGNGRRGRTLLLSLTAWRDMTTTRARVGRAAKCESGDPPRVCREPSRRKSRGG
eukprot:756-Pelagococcus_subviridis.AAC.2